MLRTDLVERSVAKAITYRILIMVLDFSAILFFTGRMKVAVGFMIASNLYTTVAYILHERIWARVRWGTEATRTAPIV